MATAIAPNYYDEAKKPHDFSQLAEEGLETRIPVYLTFLQLANVLKIKHLALENLLVHNRFSYQLIEHETYYFIGEKEYLLLTAPPEIPEMPEPKVLGRAPQDADVHIQMELERIVLRKPAKKIEEEIEEKCRFYHSGSVFCCIMPNDLKRPQDQKPMWDKLLDYARIDPYEKGFTGKGVWYTFTDNPYAVVFLTLDDSAHAKKRLAVQSIHVKKAEGDIARILNAVGKAVYGQRAEIAPWDKISINSGHVRRFNIEHLIELAAKDSPATKEDTEAAIAEEGEEETGEEAPRKRGRKKKQII